MRRGLTASGLLLGGLLALTATGQPPADKAAPPPKPADKKPAEVDKLIEQALAHDPDVKVARAKVALAEAELAKTRQGVAVKVATLRAAVAQHRESAAAGRELVRMTEQRVQAGAAPAAELVQTRAGIADAEARLAAAEAELKVLTGDGPKAAAPPPDQNPEVIAQLAAMLGHRPNDRAALAWLAQGLKPGQAPACNGCHDVKRDGDLLGMDWTGCHGIQRQALAAAAAPAAPKGAVADRVRAALDKPVRLGAKNAKVTFEQAVELFKEAGLDVPVRAEVKVGAVVSLGEELPVRAWLQLFADGTPGTRILLREYGLLVTTKDLAPPDGTSVFDVKKHARVPLLDAKTGQPLLDAKTGQPLYEWK